MRRAGGFPVARRICVLGGKLELDEAVLQKNRHMPCVWATERRRVLPGMPVGSIFSPARAPKSGQSFKQRNLMRKTVVRKYLAVFVAIAALAMAASSQEKKESTEAHKIVRFGDLKWTPIIKGCDLAPVAGDMNTEATPFVLRIRCADGSKIPAHWHPTDENVTVLKGTFLVGMGESFDESKLQTMNVGNFVTVPKEMRHFAMTKGETIVQVHAMGPFKVNWVNPSEVDPPGAAAKPKS